jgi:hypothetical protein
MNMVPQSTKNQNVKKLTLDMSEMLSHNGSKVNDIKRALDRLNSNNNFFDSSNNEYSTEKSSQ